MSFEGSRALIPSTTRDRNIKRLYWPLKFFCWMSIVLMIFSSFGIVESSSVILNNAQNSKEVVARYFAPAFASYKQSYRPSSLSVASILLRGIRDSKIAGGTQASSHEFPFLVSIQTTSRQHYCGGSLIAANFVLSAAHCFVSGTTVENPSNVYVLPGTNDRTCTSCARYRGKTISVHPNYDDQTTRNDIAILELLSSVPIDGTNVKLANVEGGSYPIDGSKTLTVSGWGYTTGFSLPTMLMKTDVVVNPVSVCLLLDMISPNQICAGGNGHDSCAGDSGGPLFRIDSSNNFVILGLVSYGDDGCGEAQTFNNKGVYTNTTYYLSFIKSKVPSVGVISNTVVTPTNNIVNTTVNSTITSNTTINNSTANNSTYSNSTSNNNTFSNSTSNNGTSNNNTFSNSTTVNNTTSTNNSISGNATWNNSTNGSTITNCSLANCNTTQNGSIPLPPPTPIPSTSIPNLSNSTSNSTNSNNSTKNNTAILHPNEMSIATPYFHYIVSTLIMLFISTCFNNFTTI